MKCQECRKLPTFVLTSHPDNCQHTHYAHHIIESFEDIKDVFPEGKADGLNWFVASTSGVHGSYTTIKEIENAWDVTDEDDPKYVGRYLTVLIIQPRVVTMKHGDIKIESREQLGFLKGLIASSIEEIAKAQEENV